MDRQLRGNDPMRNSRPADSDLPPLRLPTWEDLPPIPGIDREHPGRPGEAPSPVPYGRRTAPPVPSTPGPTDRPDPWSLHDRLPPDLPPIAGFRPGGQNRPRFLPDRPRQGNHRPIPGFPIPGQPGGHYGYAPTESSPPPTHHRTSGGLVGAPASPPTPPRFGAPDPGADRAAPQMPFRDRHPTGPSPIAPEPASPLAVAITAIESNQMAYGAKVYEELFALDFRLREKFPFKMSAQYNRIVVGLIHVLRAVDQAATRSPSDLERVLEFARQLGRDHRKYLVERCHYNLMELALRRALAYIDITDAEVTQAFSSAVHTLATTMVDAAEAETTPARWVARVVAVERRTRDITVVRLEAGEPVLYYPGQYLSVSVPQFPGTWRFMSPALPPGPEGYVEFHVKAVEGGRTSRQIVIGTRPGDDWILANPHGSLEIREDARDVLMVAGSTGLAPLRALILDLANRGDAPRVHLFFGAKYPGELYDLPTLWGLAQSLPWLTVQPCVEVDEDPWWLHPSWGGQIPRGLHLRKIGRLSDIVTTYGNWADRQILVSGSPSMVGETVKALVAAGTPREIIDHDPY